MSASARNNPGLRARQKPLNSNGPTVSAAKETHYHATHTNVRTGKRKMCLVSQQGFQLFHFCTRLLLVHMSEENKEFPKKYGPLSTPAARLVFHLTKSSIGTFTLNNFT